MWINVIFSLGEYSTLTIIAICNHVRNGGTGGGRGLPIFWQISYPSSTRGEAYYTHHITTGTPNFFDFPPCLHVCKKRFAEKTNLSNSDWDVKLFTVSRRCLPLNKVDMAFVVRQMCYMLLYANLRLIEITQVGTYRRKEKKKTQENNSLSAVLKP